MDKNRVNLNKQCKVCYQNILDNFCLVSNCCKSRFHHACLQECLNAQLSNFNSATKCPNFDCGQDISDKDIQILDQNQSQLKKPQQQREKPKSLKKKIQNCDICVEQMDENTIQSLGCSDKYHKKCLEEYFKVEIMQKKLPIKCPNHMCQHQIQPYEIKQILEEQDYEKYDKFQLENYIDQDKSQVYQRCLTPDCEYVFIKEIEIVKFNCPTCYYEYCLVCQCKYHTSQTCKEYQKAVNLKKLDEQFGNFVQEKNLKQCSQCQRFIEKNQGCNHMTCICNYEFCYVCGGPYNQCECTKHVERINQQQNTNNLSRNTSQQQRQQILPNPIQPQQNNNQIIVQPSTNILQIQQRQIDSNQAMLQRQNQSQSNQPNQQTNQRNQQPTNRNLNQQQINDSSQQIRYQQNNFQRYQLQNSANRDPSITQDTNQIQILNHINTQQVKQLNQDNLFNFDRAPSQNMNSIQNQNQFISPQFKQQIQLLTNRDRSTSLYRNQILQQSYFKSPEQKQYNQLKLADRDRSTSQSTNQIQYQKYVKQKDVKQQNQSKFTSRETSISKKVNQIQQQNHQNSSKLSELSNYTKQNLFDDDDDQKLIKNIVYRQQIQNDFMKLKSNKQDELSKKIQNDNFSNNSGSNSKKIITKNQSQKDLQDIKQNILNNSPQIQKNSNHRTKLSLNVNSVQKQIIEKQDYIRELDQIQYYSTKNQQNQIFNLSYVINKIKIAQADPQPSKQLEKIYIQQTQKQNKENKNNQNQKTMNKTTNTKTQKLQINQRLDTNFYNESNKIDESDEINKSF